MPDDNEPAIVYSGSQVDAALLWSIVDAEGIPAYLQDQQMGTLAFPFPSNAGPFGGVKIAVPARVAKRAERIVREFIRKSV